MVLPGKHAVIVGQNGSGKSQMLIHLSIANEQRRVILDTKFDDDFLHLANSKQKLIVVYSYRALVKALKQKFDYLIIRPAKFELNNPKSLDNYLLRLSEEKGLTIFIDEAYPFHSSGRCGDGMLGILTRGRSAGLSLVVCTQRPAWVSNFIYSEATYFIVYRLLQLKDRKKVAEFIPYNAEMPPPFHFYYFSLTDDDEVTLCEPINIFKRPVKKLKNKLNLI